MQRATAEDGGVLCEFETKRACVGLLEFKSRGDFRIKVKLFHETHRELLARDKVISKTAGVLCNVETVGEI